MARSTPKSLPLNLAAKFFAVPGNINSLMSKGTNRLIRSAQGACVLDFEDIVCVFRQNIVKSSTVKLSQLSFDDQKIVSVLERSEKTIEELTEENWLPNSKT